MSRWAEQLSEVTQDTLRRQRRTVAVAPEMPEELARAGPADHTKSRHAHEQTSDYEQYVNDVPVVGQDVDKSDHGGK